jgi:hypothetical protein
MEFIDTKSIPFDSPARDIAMHVNQEINYIREWEGKVASAQYTLAEHRARLARFQAAYERIKDL